jgi:anti-anti-sigma factor
MAFDEGTDPPPGGAEGSWAVFEVGIEVVAAGVHVLRVAGEIDALTTGAFAAALHRAAVRPAELVIVDLTRVTFLAAAGIGALAGAFRRATGSGIELRLAGPVRGVRRAMALTGFLDVVVCHETVAEALAPTT